MSNAQRDDVFKLEKCFVMFQHVIDTKMPEFGSSQMQTQKKAGVIKHIFKNMI